jgi:hypothetical protein
VEQPFLLELLALVQTCSQKRHGHHQNQTVKWCCVMLELELEVPSWEDEAWVQTLMVVTSLLEHHFLTQTTKWKVVVLVPGLLSWEWISTDEAWVETWMVATVPLRRHHLTQTMKWKVAVQVPALPSWE